MRCSLPQPFSRHNHWCRELCSCSLVLKPSFSREACTHTIAWATTKPSNSSLQVWIIHASVWTRSTANGIVKNYSVVPKLLSVVPNIWQCDEQKLCYTGTLRNVMIGSGTGNASNHNCIEEFKEATQRSQTDHFVHYVISVHDELNEMLMVPVQSAEEIGSIKGKIMSRHSTLFAGIDELEVQLLKTRMGVEFLRAPDSWHMDAKWGTQEAPIVVKVKHLNLRSNGTTNGIML
jgi:hypothetical protein